MTTGNFYNHYQPVHCAIHTLLREYLTSRQLAEVVYRDEAGQIQTVHDVIRDLFTRAGEEFLLLGRGQLVRLDHVITLDGQLVTSIGVA